MSNTILSILFFLFFISNTESRECLLYVRNNFLRYYFNIENYKFQKVLHGISNTLFKIHYITVDKCYDWSIKYYSLTNDEKELLEAITFFI